MKQLSLNEMLNLKGGISKEEYCAILVDMLAHYDMDEKSVGMALYALRKHC